MYNNMAV